MQVVGKRDSSYLVNDGQHWSHGATLDEARESLLYKASNRDPSQYRGLTTDSLLTFAEALACYRTLTGACAAGVRHFVEGLGAEVEKFKAEGVTVGGILELTRGRFGHEAFATFFLPQKDTK